MKLVVISPKAVDPREIAALGNLFAAGLERYHVRKPAWSREETAAWLLAQPAAWRPRFVLHHHHDLVAELGLGGRHWRDDASAPATPPAGMGFASRSCHDLATLRAALGRYDAVFISPIFPSLSKPGHAPRADFPFTELSSLLAARTRAERHTCVFALGGITPENSLHCRDLGFDGVAVLGAIWQSADPGRAFARLQTALQRHAA